MFETPRHQWDGNAVTSLSPGSPDSVVPKARCVAHLSLAAVVATVSPLKAEQHTVDHTLTTNRDAPSDVLRVARFLSQ